MAEGQSEGAVVGVPPANIETDSAAETTSKVNALGMKSDLLRIIWKTLQENTERRDKIRGEEKLERERNRKSDEEKWDRNRKEDEERREKLSEKVSDLNPLLLS
jgi:hypothetical protein